MPPVLLALLIVFSSLVLYLVYKAKKINKFWKEKGVPHVEPYIFAGNSLKTVFRMCTQGERMKEVCDEFPDEQFVGYYDFMKPMCLVKDASLAEKVLIKDFPHFVDRGFDVDETKNPLDISIANMTGKRWRAVRNKFSPIFTTGKLRIMFDQMIDIGNSLTSVIELSDLKCVQLQELLGRFAMDVIGSFAFGIDAGNLANGDSEFRRMGKKAFILTKVQFIKFIIITNFPNLAKKLGIAFNNVECQKYFVKIIRDTLEYRRKNNVKRNDFVDLMLQVKDKGSVEIQTKDPSDDYLNIESEKAYVTDSFEITDDLLVGQAFTFLTAGFEGTATAMTYLSYELAKNPDIQKKARAEVFEKVEENGGKLNFEALKDMNYLEMCLKESLRKYPPAQMVFRICTKQYTLPDGNVIKPGETLIVSVYSIHYNPQYYPNPTKYDPQRFSPDIYQQPCTFLPFGEGPRVCIAMRFALIQIKFALAKLLMEYDMSINPKTKEPLETSKKSFLMTPKYPIYFDLKKVSRKN